MNAIFEFLFCPAHGLFRPMNWPLFMSVVGVFSLYRQRVGQATERFLRRRFRYKEIGWTEIGEQFTRYALLTTRWFNLYLHQLNAPQWHPDCHDHPWGFVAILLWRGYLEKVGNKTHRRYPGMVLFRPATFLHNVITPYGVSWSLIITTPKKRDWGFRPCDRSSPAIPYDKYRKLHSEVLT